MLIPVRQARDHLSQIHIHPRQCRTKAPKCTKDAPRTRSEMNSERIPCQACEQVRSQVAKIVVGQDGSSNNC